MAFHLDQAYRIKVNKEIFWQSSTISFQRLIESIDDNVFKSLDFLKKILFCIYNMRTACNSSNENKWVAEINYGNDFNPQFWYNTGQPSAHQAMIHQSTYSHLMESMHIYPNEDFCLFRHFPRICTNL